MNFFVVPAVLYQTQQKIDKAKKEREGKNPEATQDPKKKKKLVKRVRRKERDGSDSSSLGSSLTETSESTHSKERPATLTPPSMEEEGRPSMQRSTSASSSHFRDFFGSFSASSPRHNDEVLLLDDKHRNSMASLLALLVNSKYRRNSLVVSGNTASSVGSGNNSAKHLTSSRFQRKLSTSFLGHDKTPSEPKSPTVESPRHFVDANEHKETNEHMESNENMETNEHMESNEHKEEPLLPEFKPIIDLSLLNTTESMSTVVNSVPYHVFRFNYFLEIMSDYHYNDPTNFAQMRLHSLRKVIDRIQAHNYSMDDPLFWKHHEAGFYETALFKELASMRSLLRLIIRKESLNVTGVPIVHSEETLQVNTTKYVRYLINLPILSEADIAKLDETELKHYHNKIFFVKMADALYRIEKGEESESLEMDTIVHKTDLLVKVITKVSYDYIILEKYHVQILAQLNCNSIVDYRVLQNLFRSYKQRLKDNNPELTKVLFYNTFYSAQYLWFLALTVPFARIFETNVYSEGNYESSPSQADFSASDEKLFETYFKKLFYTDFELFRDTSVGKLVKVHKMLDNLLPKYHHFKKHEVADPLSMYSIKPLNFEYYSNPLSTIPLNLFDLIHFRDPILQLNGHNIRTILQEHHRILRPGGTLELPLAQIGNDSFKQSIDSSSIGKLTGWGRLENALNGQYGILPNFCEKLLRVLKEIFGTVKYSIVVLDLKNEVNDFWLRHMKFVVYEMTSHFHAMWDSSESKNVQMYYYIHIVAEKQ